MSFDLSLIKNKDEDVFFTIGYSAWMLLDEIFEGKSFWFDDLIEKEAEKAIPYIESAIKKLNLLPEEGTIEKRRPYTKERYLSLVNQLDYMLKCSEEKKDYVWYISI